VASRRTESAEQGGHEDEKKNSGERTYLRPSLPMFFSAISSARNDEGLHRGTEPSARGPCSADGQPHDPTRAGRDREHRRCLSGETFLVRTDGGAVALVHHVMIRISAMLS